MPDPIVGAVVAKTAKAVSGDTNKIAPGLLQSVLGPPAKEFGEALGRIVAYKTQNFGRIIQKADARLKKRKRAGIVNRRVAFALLEEGSLCDDELMAEYLGGLLAGSKSPDGRDDRAVTWTHTVTTLSSFQIRAHYLIYRELARYLYRAARYLDLSYDSKMKTAIMCLDLEEFETSLMALMVHCKDDPEAILRHSMWGLTRSGLINDTWYYGKSYAFKNEIVRVMPTGRGMELYGWLLGISDLVPKNFASRAFMLEIPTGIPHLQEVTMPLLNDDDDDDDDDAYDNNPPGHKNRESSSRNNMIQDRLF